jgi:hypothetical protein
MKNLKWFLILVVLVGVFIVAVKSDPPVPGSDDIACTLEARQCPDGSYVGRSGPNCEFAPCPNPVNSGEVKVGETKVINGVNITFNKVVEDSRCPSDVQCIQAGRLVANVTLKSDTDTETFNMILGTSKAFDSYTVRFVDALPAPVSTVPQASRNYRLVFEVK